MNMETIRIKASDTLLKLAEKTENSGMHRNLMTEPKGKGWVHNFMEEGLFCKPEKLKEAIEYYKISFEVRENFLPLYRIAYAFEAIGEIEKSIEYFKRVIEFCESNYDSSSSEYDIDTSEIYMAQSKEGIKRCHKYKAT